MWMPARLVCPSVSLRSIAQQPNLPTTTKPGAATLLQRVQCAPANWRAPLLPTLTCLESDDDCDYLASPRTGPISSPAARTAASSETHDFR